MTLNPLQLAVRLAEVIRDKLGDNIVILDLRREASATDFFVITTATSPVHARALARDVQDRLATAGVMPHHIEGEDNGQWILLDYLDVVVHIFLENVREFYGLERLWGDVPRRIVSPIHESQ